MRSEQMSNAKFKASKNASQKLLPKSKLVRNQSI